MIIIIGGYQKRFHVLGFLSSLFVAKMGALIAALVVLSESPSVNRSWTFLRKEPAKPTTSVVGAV